MFPHERSLVKRLAGKPFALVGVNSDADLDEIRQTCKEKNISWRSFWNGPQGPGGPIARAWNVRGWPTTFLIDHKGIIRAKNLRAAEEIDARIDELVAEAERDAQEESIAEAPAEEVQDEEVQDEEVSLAARIQAIQDDYKKAYDAFVAAYRAAKPEDRRKILREQRPKVADWAERMWAAVENDPSRAEAADGLAWLFRQSRPHRKQASEALLTHHIGSEHVASVASSLARMTDADSRDQLRRIIDESPSRSVKGRACFSLAQSLISGRERTGGADEAASEAAIRRCLKRTIDEFGDLKDRRSGTLGEAAEAALDALEERGIGRTAPEIAAADTDGVEFELSDYRGKVIMLDFWGNW